MVEALGRLPGSRDGWDETGKVSRKEAGGGMGRGMRAEGRDVRALVQVRILRGCLWGQVG